MPSSNQKEVIDTRILGLIGLEDVFDLDYETYLTLLKEAMVKGRMAKTTIPTEEIELLTNEYKRVKTKKDKGRFEVKSKKITAGSFAVGSVKAKLTGTKSKGLLPAAIGKSSIASSLTDSIATITSAVTSILDTLKAQKSLVDGATAFDRKKTEQDKRALAESKLEKRFEGLKKTAEKMLAPVKSLLDKVIDFFVTVFFGRVVYKLVEWLGDPENASKVKSIIRFLGDWWPAILGAYILFGNSFSGLIRGTMGIVGRFIFQIGKVGIPQLLKFLKSPLGIGVGLFTAGATIPALLPGTVNEQETKTKKAPGSPEDKIRSLQQQKSNLNLFEKLQGKGAEIDEQIYSLQSGKTKSYGFTGGGLTSGFVSGEKGVDKVPAMLTDGEFVMSTGAVQKYGVDTLEGMNAAGGGTNKPKIVSGTTYAAGGGMVGENPDPNYKDPVLGKRLDLMKSIENYAKSQVSSGGDTNIIKSLNNLSLALKGRSSGMKLPSNNKSSSTGSLLTDPVGAITRIANNMGIKTPNVPQSSRKSPPSSGGGVKTPGSSSSKKEGFFNDLKSSTFRDAGSIYAKQMLGGMGGPVSEQDLGEESKAELQKAIQRAKKRTGSEISKTEAKIKELESSGASKTQKGKEALATQRSFLKKLKAGGIRVQYTDYTDEKGRMSESAKNAKNILGQFWAQGRDKKEGGGYRIEDKYDFDKLKKKDEKTGKMRDMNVGEIFKEGILGKGKTIRQRLQAAHQLNPFKGKGDVDMVLGGRRTASETMGLAGSKTMLGGMLGMSGKPKPKSTQANVAKTKPKNIRGVTPPTSAKPRVVYGPPAPKRGIKGSGRSSSNSTPSFSATTRGGSAKQQTLGLNR